MKRMISSLMALALVALPLLAARDKKETGRLENCGLIVKEVMDIPDNIPEDLINKAECIIVFPSVLKAAFVIGGSYGRGAMTCRSGEHFTGPWSAPAMMALEGGTVRPDNDGNERIYGKKVEAESIVFKGAVAVPPAAQKLIAYLNQKSPKNTSDPESLK